MANTYSLVITSITDTTVDVKVVATTNPSTTAASLIIAVSKTGETGAITQTLSDPGTNSGQLVGAVSFASLTPSTQYTVTLNGDPNVGTTVKNFTTKIDRNTPRSATQLQWEDISSKVKAKADKTGVDSVTGNLSNLTTTDKSNLVAAINEVAGSGGGGSSVVTALTSDDLNWDSSGQEGDPDSIATWLLPVGWYTPDMNDTPTVFTSSDGMGIIGKGNIFFSDGFGTITTTFVDDTGDNGFQLYSSDPSTGEEQESSSISFNWLLDMDSNLTILSEKYQYGNSAPTTSTFGDVGYIYCNTSTAEMYICTNCDYTDPNNPVYTWTKVSGSGDGVIELTSADYDYPIASPDGVALWSLGTGLYNAPNGVKVYWDSSNSGSVGNRNLLISNIGGVTGTGIFTIGNGTIAAKSVDSSGTLNSSAYLLTELNIQNNLTTTTSGQVLDARQGKVLDDKIPVITLTATDPGEGSPLAANNFIAVYNP